MHIMDGALSGIVLATGAVTALAGTYIGMKKIKSDDLPKVSLLTAAFFCASLVHVPIGISSVHLIFNGVIGLIVGFAAFPVFLVGLILQMAFFQFGGWTTLGVNTLNIALPSVLNFYLFSKLVNNLKDKKSLFIAGFISGSFSIVLTGLMVSLSLLMSDGNFLYNAEAALVAHVPVMLIEGVVSGFIVYFIKTVKPELLIQPSKKDTISSKPVIALFVIGALMGFVIVKYLLTTDEMWNSFYSEYNLIESFTDRLDFLMNRSRLFSQVLVGITAGAGIFTASGIIFSKLKRVKG